MHLVGGVGMRTGDGFTVRMLGGFHANSQNSFIASGNLPSPALEAGAC